MSDDYEARLRALGVSLPEAPGPAANYAPWVRSGAMLFVSGQISKAADGLMTGKLGADATVEQGQAAARVCAINLIAQVKAACGGDLSRLRRVVKLTGFVNAVPGFTEHPQVVNGASDLMAEAFGEAGVHARAAVGCGSLPLGVMVEVEGIFEIA